jgi:hypothetical protein
LITGLKNKDGPVKCPVCGKDLDGRITYAQVAGETRATWVHANCLGKDKK